MAEDRLKELAAKYANRRSVVDSGEDVFFKSGSVIMDSVLSDGLGVPAGKIIQLSSESGLGKTTIALTMCKAAVKQGKRVVYIDVENGVNESQMKGMGVYQYLDDGFFLYKVPTFEETEEILDAALEDPNVVYIVIDSITAMIPKKSLDKSVSDLEPGLHARYASEFFKKYRAKVLYQENKPTIWIINQMRTRLNFRGMTTYAAAGGSAQKFFADIRLNMRESKKLTKTTNTIDGKKQIQYGSENYIWADKNRFNAPFVEAVITVIFGRGVSNLMAYRGALERLGALHQGGGGNYTINVPGEEPIKARGTVQLQEVIRKNLPVIKKYVDDNGGFKLMEMDDGNS